VAAVVTIDDDCDDGGIVDGNDMVMVAMMVNIMRVRMLSILNLNW
jgi:hypothetical protein